MSLLVNLYDSASLTEAVNIMKTPEPFILNAIFKTKVPHETDNILFEEYIGSEEIAEFIHGDEPNPRNIKKQAKKAKALYLPRTFESKLFTAQELSRINAIGALFSDQAVKKQKQQEYITQELAELKNRVIRRREQMACEALSTGKLEISQDNIDIDYDFGFETDKQLITLATAKLWTATTSNPVTNIREWKKAIAKLSGVAVKNVVMGTAAAEAFLANEKVAKILDNNNYRAGSVDITGDATGSAIYLGRVAGVDIWEYTQQYMDGSTATDMIPTDRAIAIGDSKNFRLHYGPAFRIQNGVAVPIVSEMYLEVDKNTDDKGLQWNLEQKSLPAIHDKGCVISAKVV